jgi:hypothetical protein
MGQRRNLPHAARVYGSPVRCDLVPPSWRRAAARRCSSPGRHPQRPGPEGCGGQRCSRCHAMLNVCLLQGKFVWMCCLHVHQLLRLPNWPTSTGVSACHGMTTHLTHDGFRVGCEALEVHKQEAARRGRAPGKEGGSIRRRFTVCFTCNRSCGARGRRTSPGCCHVDALLPRGRGSPQRRGRTGP